MKRYLEGKMKWIVITVVAILLVFSVWGIFNIRTNYDMSLYLPKDSHTAQGLEVLEETFGNQATIEVMLQDVTMEEVIILKNEIADDEQVLEAIWLDDVLAMMGISWSMFQSDFFWAMLDEDEQIQLEETISTYYVDERALIQVIFLEDSYSLEVGEAIHRIEELLSEEIYYMRGEAIEQREARNIAEGEVFKLLLIITPIALVILLIASRSWIEPLLVLVTLGIAVLLNMGSNALLPHVSFVTMTIAAALQLAISLDYSLFLLHRYYEERPQHDTVTKALEKAVRKSWPSITASALTTITGFSVLMFMQYRIGLDIGLVLSKGIILSYLSVIVVLPILIYLFANVIEKTMHKTWMPPLRGARVFHKFRFVLLGLFLIISVFGFIYQRELDYRYGTSGYTDDDSIVVIHEATISEHFGHYSPVVILAERISIHQEIELVESLMALDHVKAIDALVTRFDPSTPRSSIPQEIRDRFISDTHIRFIVYTDIIEEDESMYAFSDALHQVCQSVYPDRYYALGITVSTTEIKEVVSNDGWLVSIVSVLAIAFIIMVAFKSISLPVILVFSIQTAIWLNLSISALSHAQPVYIGYLVVFALQLGATIDYAVLLSNRYMEFRKTHTSFEAIRIALEKSSTPIMISALVLASAGFAEAIFSDLQAVTEIGLLIGRGAILSLLVVLVFVPAMLLVFDKVIHFTTITKKASSHSHEDSSDIL